ncbi:hypothetical protein K435DRAFT_875137 [Dendrothele bispora CBS 962.96]|uniref:Uncharacterized protein n=1 Tax=Dendrothele bispora (strain CBS 962.96) TaxID=1314807 RepID=A0A4S8KUZ3_DENBC|nr:hypothetical protein K435DRAFT_875137 [Dendrothele bispora CBS 962.96]
MSVAGNDELNLAAPASGALMAQSASISVPAVQHPLPRSQRSGSSQLNQPSPAPSFQSPAHSPRSHSTKNASEVSPVPENVSELTHKVQSLVDRVRTTELVKEMREHRSPSPIPNRNAAVKEAAWASLRSVLHDAENTANLHSSNTPAPPAPFVPVTAPALVTSSVPELLLAVVPHLTELDSIKQLSSPPPDLGTAMSFC